MELVKNIFFNTDRLVANEIVKISYTGLFFQNGATNVYIRYGFGEEWENLVEKEMIKTELGFQIEIPLENKGTLNFCIKNEKDEWDNNNGENYIFEIQKPETSLAVIDDKKSLKKLRKTYIWSKKLKITIYKILISIPKIITGNYRKKLTNQEQNNHL